MDQVALLTALLLMSILDQGAYSDQHKRLVVEIPFEKGETQIEREEQTSKLYDARNAVLDARKNADVRVIIEGYFDGQADTDNTRRGVARAAATKRWLQTVGGLYGIAMDDRLGASGENKRVAKILIEETAKGPDATGHERPDESRVVKDIEFARNSSQVANIESLLDAWYEIRADVQQKGSARLVIEGDAAPTENNAMAENRATVVKRWFDARQPIPNLQLSTKTGQENKSVVRLIIEREQRRTSR
jgi:outer membrane protein OmpA-like peptidoglycan-associated protein